jgi:hypothetical protein
MSPEPSDATTGQMPAFNSFRAASKEDWSGARASTFSKLRDITLPYEIL